MVCHCLQVTRQELELALTGGQIFTINEIRKQTGAGDGCTACHARLKQILQDTVFTVHSTAKCG